MIWFAPRNDVVIALAIKAMVLRSSEVPPSPPSPRSPVKNHSFISLLLLTPRGSYNNVIADNVIHDTAYPGIFVYGAAGML